MKFKRFSQLVALGLVLISFANAKGYSLDEVLLCPNQCYYWIGLHDRGLYELEADQLRDLIEAYDGDPSAKGSERERAVLLLGARWNNIDINRDTLTAWMSNLSGTAGRKTNEDILIHEIVMTLGAQGMEDELRYFLGSEHLPVREAAFSALLFHADQTALASMLERERKRTARLKIEAQKVVEAYKSDPVRGAESGKRLAAKSQFAPSAVRQLRDYFFYQSYEQSDEDWLRMIGKGGLIRMRSTATARNMLGPGVGGYLEHSLGNKFLLQKLDEIFEKTSSRAERLELERVFRAANAESGIADPIHNAPLFYLLGFELTEEERAYLVEQTGLAETQILPSGRMHLIGGGFFP